MATVWPEFIPFLAFPVEVRKIIYTTNAIESLNASSVQPPDVAGTSPTNNQP